MMIHGFSETFITDFFKTFTVVIYLENVSLDNQVSICVYLKFTHVVSVSTSNQVQTCEYYYCINILEPVP